MSHSGSSFGYRCIAVTAVRAVWVFVRSALQFSVETSGTIDLSRRPKIFVTAATSKFWAKILPGGYITGHLKILPEMCPLGKILAQDFGIAAVTKILGRQDKSVVPPVSRENCETLLIKTHTGCAAVTAMQR